MEAAIKNMQGQEVGKVSLPQEIFGLDANKALLHQVVVALQANKRQGTHATKTRALVSGGGRKPFRQKGTGNARQGSRRSPLMRGGATVHGPMPRSYRQALPRKVKGQALKIMLSDRLRTGNLHVIDKIVLDSYSTKTIIALLSTFGIRKVLVSDVRSDDYLYRSARNIYRTDVKDALHINALDVAAHDCLLVTTAGIKSISARLGGGDDDTDGNDADSGAASA
ncbi:MAG: 50S ribosomal protein L4 [Pseudomonadota bacterium]|nr:50S ribosomal protein L4 [Pseudomonadota bacterium]